MKEIAIIGVPIETVFQCNEFNLPYEVYLPGSTDKIRKYLIECNKNYNSVNLVDKGELNLESSKKELLIDVSKNYERNLFSKVDLDTIKEKKDFVLKQKENFDHTICVGPSHFGAILLYQKKDIVARFDFHGDYEPFYEKNPFKPNYATYMNIVKKMGKINVINYGWGGSYLDDEHKKLALDLFGEEGEIGDNKHKNANHFDIDVDCFKKESGIAMSRDCGRLMPKQLEGMISVAKPKKIGIWEYRWNYDNGNGKRFIENVIFKCLTGQK